MASVKSEKSSSRKQQSLSFDKKTIERIEEEAQRRGVAKSTLVEEYLNAQMDAKTIENQSKPTIIPVLNYKGGVGKSTTSANLGVCLAEEGYRVLIIDLDGQGNISQMFRVFDPNSEKMCIADVLFQSSPKSKRLTLDEVMQETDYENLFVVPSNFRFADADARMKSEGSAGIDSRLCYAIMDMETAFDYIIIDCGPRLDMTTTNAIVALETGNDASHIIIPVKIDGFAIAGVAQTVEMINHTAKERRTQPKPYRILKTVVEPNTTAYKEGCEELKRAIPSATYFQTSISKSTRAGESTLAFLPLVAYDPTCKPSLDYRTLAREIEAMNE